MSQRKDHDVAGVQPAMFTYKVHDPVAAKLAILAKPRWVYPCGLCNDRQVTEPGGLCSVCAPAPLRSRRKTAATKKTATKKAAAKTATSRPEVA